MNRITEWHFGTDLAIYTFSINFPVKAECAHEEAQASMKMINSRAPADPKINGRYANYFKVGHNAFEFFLDFGQSQGESEGVSIHTSIVTAPGYAKAFLETLRESIAKHEEEFGIIRRDHGDVES